MFLIELMTDEYRGTDMEKVITIEYWYDEGWYIGRLQDMPGIYNQGESLEQLGENIIKAYSSLYPDLEVEYDVHYFQIDSHE